MPRAKKEKQEVVFLLRSQIDPPAEADRTIFSEAKMLELAESIRKVGILEPLLVTKEGDRFQIIAGHRRFIAAGIAGVLRLPCLAMKNCVQVSTARYHENAYREDLNPLDDAFAVARYVEEHPENTQKEVAAELGRSAGYISQRLKILSYPVCLQNALKNEDITFSVARELAHIDDEGYLASMVDFAKENGCTPATARIWKQQYLNSQIVTPETDESEEGEVLPTGQAPIYFCEACRETIKDASAAVTMILHARCRDEILAALKVTDG